MRAAMFSCFVSLGFLGFAGSAAAADAYGGAGEYCTTTATAANFPELAGLAERPRRMICADVAALDQMLVYNRFGSHDPYGMMFALVRDLVPAATPVPANLNCDEDLGLGAPPAALEPGAVRLRDCKRPRPLTLRANVGDVVHVRVHNLLRTQRPGYSETFCRQAGVVPGTFAQQVRAEVSEGGAAGEEGHYRAVGDRLVAAMCPVGSAVEKAEPARVESDWPSTRGINFVIDGLRPLADPLTHAVDPVCLGLGQLQPGTETVDCYWHAEREGPHFVNSIAAASGGEGDGGSLVHGLFGSLAVEPQDANEPTATAWYRSQVSPEAFDEAWKPADSGLPHARTGTLDYTGLDLLQPLGDGRYEIVHNDLNAIIAPAGKVPFREFTVMFHDELKTFYTSNFEELDRFSQFAGIRDGFGINYGSSGLGALVLANRKGIGPAAGCAECLYEEFFLESWANGDPALLERYTDDPSNVHHSYLGDPVVFRNYHAGPKETHVFHLHAHQWLGGNDVGRGAYLDSQTVAPRQGFTYNIYGGGRAKAEGADEDRWAVAGSGNRNLTVGDSIFHCHLYPHFAQGMWELWRVHDVLEDGTRKLPDGQARPGLSTGIVGTDGARQGSVADDGSFVEHAAGTPIPGLVPLPRVAAPLLPTYAVAGDTEKPVPGYPFFVAGKPGHRAPQAPLDMALENGEPLDGGLPRHVVMDGSSVDLGVGGPQGSSADDLYRLTAKMLALGDFSGHLTAANLDVLPADGTDREKAAMAFHDDGAGLKLRDARGDPSDYAAAGGYASIVPDVAGETALRFAVNGSPPKPGAPFADPCGAPGTAAADSRVDPLDGKPFRPDPKLTGFRRYAASAVQVDLVTNKAGWHDPQGRINVLTADSDGYKDFGPKTDEEPFFFRAYSGECIEFRHTNELPKELELDDFQVQTPTDTIGQHIHLVKFDVTSADGSGNGWNYEDGTFAADEIATRLCAMLDPAQATPKVGAGSTLSDTDRARIEAETVALCVREGAGEAMHWKPQKPDYWKEKLNGGSRARFQTTVQRWFADPILSVDNDVDGATGARQDRTLRTVFTHDHFGPSSIQQHGFYSALVIEPAGKDVCPGTIVAPGEPDCLKPPAADFTLADDGARGVGTHKVVRTPDPSAPAAPGAEPVSDAIHPDYREFALAIADFALLYDPTDGSKADVHAASGDLPGGGTLPDPGPSGIDPRDVTFGQPKGLARLVCEAEHRAVGDDPAAIEEACGSDVPTEAIGAMTRVVETAGIPPAVVASALIRPEDVMALRQKFVLVRTRAGHGEGFARPVNAPDRPEMISADHHDPYLVNYNGEPVPLRIGDTGSKTAFDCYVTPGAGKVVAVPGEAFPDDATIAALAQKPSPDCSIVSQSADPRGNVANVFRSVFDPNETQLATAPSAEPPARAAAAAAAAGDLVRNRAHGDPATPLLETYSGERVQFRLIQGAQEVQHTFNLEGLAWRRQVDQRYPSAGRPLDTDLAGETWWQTCRERGLHGIAAEHEKWRSGRLPNPIGNYWTNYTADVAACDNLEDFVSAQEVGISEHFEIDAVPSKYAYTVRALPDGEKEDVSLDYLYDFGSQDAIWNGAWGLMRVYENKDVKLGRDTDETAGDHLAPVSHRGTTGFRGDKETVRTGLQCPRGAPALTAWAVAMPLPGGQKYGSWGSDVRDPDALALVHVPNALAEAWKRKGWLRETTEADGKPRYDVAPARVADLRKDALGYFRDEPMVVRANAGDCLHLSIVNALAPALSGPACGSGNGIPGPMRDCLGDTRLPRIVRLNVEPTWDARDEEADGPVRHQQLDRIDVRPSARIAFTTALSMLTPGGEANLPFGNNLTAAVPPGGVQSSDYYLGLLNIDWPQLDRALGDHDDSAIRVCGTATGPADAATARAREIMRGEAETAAGAPLDLVFEENPLPDDQRGAGEKWFTIDILGATYSFRISNGAGETVATRDAAKNALTACLADRLDPATEADWPPDERIVSAIPYAFGAVPLKPMADLFDQLPHGLFGSIVVEPKGASYPGRDEANERLDPAAGPFASGTGHRGRGQNTLVRLADGRPLREFVLFYQDGLNLWDARSGNRWFPEGGGAPYPIVDDCRICDDSYDLGEKAVSYRAPAFNRRLRDALGTQIESHDDLNRWAFPSDFRLIKDSTTSNPLRLWARDAEEVMVRVVHPGGRARQRAFVTVGNDYDDQFPGFGFPHAALLAPGKSVAAAFSAPVRSGCYLWSDGPRFIEAEGAWGLLDVLNPQGDSACGFHP